mmetsp:Transcript_8550/g.22925  ORF Transcript_8550/g.22925 Transcript_8550/m.22925 type:complete len:548 (+) Transcript_8550:339-1982(+)|eukprot:CAMPEP_0202350034 /NCGR_PEP_ID=MMETSP1126-20121109/7271_1 /ASSEMBLY_ACC=CAM_ASM_000457 /TAXON_ID=3047 /ORGANISM="Dunaliella tertiolecta, Strain CCMP1320" /LENGTH=547 /DNA_ID=CAMNT_0048941931 /DNA_START=346 /DNA_END=1989 /DNA_ORIENTATION=-
MGMGMLLKSKKNKQCASSQYALQHLDIVREQWTSIADTVQDDELAGESLSLLEDEVTLVHDALKQADELQAFQTLEAIDLFLEDEDGMTWTGVEDGARTSMVHLLYAAWVTAVQRLMKLPVEKRPENLKHVLKRAATTGEELSSMCEQGAVISKALDYLQALAAAPDDAVKEDVNEEEDEEGPNMQGRPHEGTGAAEDSKEAELSIEYDFFSVYQAYVQRLRSRAQGRAEDSIGQQDGGQSLQGTGDFGTSGAEEEEEDGADFQSHVMSEAAMLRDMLKERQANGRLSALDSPKMLPVLLRVAGRLPPGDPMRQEVESAVGGPPGSASWARALAAGVQPTPPQLHLSTPLAPDTGASILPVGAELKVETPGFAPAAGSVSSCRGGTFPGIVAAAHAALDSPTKAIMGRALEVPGESGSIAAGGNTAASNLAGGFGSVISVPPSSSLDYSQPPLQQQQQEEEQVGLSGAGFLAPQPTPYPQSLLASSMLPLQSSGAYGDALAGPGLFEGEAQIADGDVDEFLNSDCEGPSYLGGIEEEQPSKLPRLAQ